MLNQAHLSRLLDLLSQLAVIVPCGLAILVAPWLLWRWLVWGLEVEDENE